jgi:5-methylcytosine-specific restriction endonuclease McrA
MSRFSPFYLGYMRSALWRTRRQRALKLAGNRCQVCGSTKRLEVHHVTYANLGHELDSDLTVLCWWCHRWHEFGKKVRQFWQWLWS